MYNAVFSVMNDHKEIWSGVFQLKGAFTKFSENLSRLTALKTEQEKDLQPLLDAVAEKRDSLIVAAHPVTNILLAYANDIKKKELIKKLKLSIINLTSSNDLDLIEYSKVIYKVAKKLYKKSLTKTVNHDNESVSIIDYGLNEKMVIDLNAEKKDFFNSLLALHEAIQNKVIMGKQITSIIKKNERLLKNKMDLLVTIFATSKTDFYKSYTEARVIQMAEPVKVKKTKGTRDEKEELPGNNNENTEN